MKQILCDSCGEQLGGKKYYELSFPGEEYDVCQECVNQKLQIPVRPIGSVATDD